MKKVFCIFLSVIVFVFNLNISACAKELSLSAQAYVLYCVENDTVVIEHNSQKRMKPASTTKIMTTLLALEKAKDDDCIVEFKDSMMSQGSSMYLKKGDALRLSSLAKGMMMASGNDAANAVALTLSDSKEEFALLMNSRAKEIGMTDTNFVTPSGLDDDNHYSTALDLSKLMCEALENKNFCDITKSSSCDVSFLKPKKQVTYENHNRLLKLYEYCIGGKTGYTKSAGRCLVSAAKKDSVTLVCVTLNASDDWNDHIKLYEYGFEQLSAVDTNDVDRDFYVKIVGAQKDELPLYCKNNDPAVVKTGDVDSVIRSVYIPQFLYAPIKADEFVGMVVYEFNGEIIAQNPLYTRDFVDIKKKKTKNFFEKIFR